jgi:antitoxin Phd
LTIIVKLAKLTVMDITATELKTRLGQYLDAAESEPVFIEKSGRKKSVLMSHSMYLRLMALEDAYWGEQALKARAEGYASPKEVERLIKRASQ